MLRLPTRSTFFPYTTLFRSGGRRPIYHFPWGSNGCNDAGLFAAAGSYGRQLPAGLSPLVGRTWLCRSEEHTSELQSHSDLVCRLLLEKKNNPEGFTPGTGII